MKYSAFEALVAIHSIQSEDAADKTELLTKNKDKLLKSCLIALDTINHPSSILKVAFILPKIAVEDQVGLSIKLISMVHQINSAVDRYYVLLIANWIMTKLSLLLLTTKQGASTLFLLFSEQWFISLWNDSEELQMPLKEELSLSLLEASLIARKEKIDDIKFTDAWLLSSVEVAEFCSKVMDWKLKKGNIMAE